jgi:hypothetical protein
MPVKSPAFLPAGISLADAARIARRHGFVLRTVVHAGEVRVVLERPGATERNDQPAELPTSERARVRALRR